MANYNKTGNSKKVQKTAFVCKDCTPFESKSQELLETVHPDVIGPLPLKDRNDKDYNMYSFL